MRSKAHWLLYLLLPLTGASCSRHYQVVKSNRIEYAVNDSRPADSGIVKLYLPYKQKMETAMNQVIGQSARLLTKEGSPESLLGNFFADATTSEAKKLVPDVDFAIPTTKGGLRNDVAAGNITLSTLFELMPFENELVWVKLKGEDTEQLINFIAATNGQPVTGIKLKIKDKKPYDILINGKPFDRRKSYNVLTSDYLANGGDNITGFNAPLERKTIGLRVRDALINYVKTQTTAGQPINAQLDGRITNN
jgi:2',3'-cyclic-nucleotide 2'-phosphodiesterase (5'-nucleotidase family)